MHFSPLKNVVQSLSFWFLFLSFNIAFHWKLCFSSILVNIISLVSSRQHYFILCSQKRTKQKQKMSNKIRHNKTINPTIISISSFIISPPPERRTTIITITTTFSFFFLSSPLSSLHHLLILSPFLPSPSPPLSLPQAPAGCMWGTLCWTCCVG